MLNFINRVFLKISMRKINKRGSWMTEESGKFILGVIAVVLLFMLAFKIAGILTQNTKYEQAKYAMQEIESTINSLKDGETGAVFLESPKDWFIISYSKESKAQNKPSTCGQENCLCICSKADKKECESRGICKVFKEKEIITFNSKNPMINLPQSQSQAEFQAQYPNLANILQDSIPSDGTECEKKFENYLLMGYTEEETIAINPTPLEIEICSVKEKGISPDGKIIEGKEKIFITN